MRFRELCISLLLLAVIICYETQGTYAQSGHMTATFLSTSTAMTVLSSSSSSTGLSIAAQLSSTSTTVSTSKSIVAISPSQTTAITTSLSLSTALESSESITMTTMLSSTAVTNVMVTTPPTLSSTRDSDSGGSNAGAIAGGVIGGIVAVGTVVVICIVVSYWLFIYKKRKDKSDVGDDGKDNVDDEDDVDDEKDVEMCLPNLFSRFTSCLHNHLSRLRRVELLSMLSNMFNRVYGYLNCSGSNADVLSATNECVKHDDDPESSNDPEDKDDLDHNDSEHKDADPGHKDDLDNSDDPDHKNNLDHIDDLDHGDNPDYKDGPDDGDDPDDHEHDDNPDALSIEMNSQECADVKMPCNVPGVADSEDLAVHPFAKMNTKQCSNIKSPHKALQVAHTMPYAARSKGLVNQPFGVHPYAVVDLQKIIDQAVLNQPTAPSFALPLPPKAKRQASLPTKTTTADDAHDETSDKLTHDVPQETTTDGAECIVSAETDAETTSTTSDANAEKKFGYADLQRLPLSDKFIVTDDAFVQYADVKTTDKI